MRVDLITEWYAALVAAKEAKLAIAKEQDLRKKVIASFEELKEGVNAFELPENYALKITYKIERKVTASQSEIEAVMASIKEKHGFVPEGVIVLKPELGTKAYRMLPPDAQAMFDDLLTITPGSHSMEIVKKKV